MAAKLMIALELCKKIIILWSEVGENNSASLLNGHQCILLSKKLLETQDALERVSLHEQFHQETGSPDVGPAIQELLHVLLRAHATLSENYSCGDKWIEEAVRQGGDVKETFCEILYDLQWCRSVLLTIFFKWARSENQFFEAEDCDGKLHLFDYYALCTAAKEDQENLKCLLRDLKANHACSGDRCDGKHSDKQFLASQLLNKLDFQAWHGEAKKEYCKELDENDREKLRNYVFLLINYQDVRRKPLLGNGGVYKADWFEEKYAFKIAQPGSEFFSIKEIVAVGGLHHPQIIPIFFCAEEESKCLYVMELMDKTLSGLFEDDERLSITEAVDLILQIAQGIKCLHGIALCIVISSQITFSSSWLIQLV